MLSRISSRFLSPDPKLQFLLRAMNDLAGPPRLVADPFYAEWYQHFDSLAEIITFLEPHSLLRAVESSQSNVTNLIHVLANYLLDTLASPNFNSLPESTPSPISTFTRFIANPNAPDDSDRSRQVLNCIRVLSRILPVVIGQNELQQFHQDLFWTKTRATESHNASTGNTDVEGGQFVIDDEEETAPPPIANPVEEEEIAPLGERLLSALVDFLFIPGFTLESSAGGSSVNYVTWEPGVASSPSSLETPPPPTSPHVISNRIEILRLLNILLSLPSLTTSPQDFTTVTNRWREAFITGNVLPRKVTLCLLCSLLNTALAKSDVDKGDAGLSGIAMQAAKKLGGVVLRKENLKEILKDSCWALLGILFLEHSTPPSSEPSSTPISPSESNQFAFFLAKLHRPTDFDFILNGLYSLFDSVLTQSQSLFPPGPLIKIESAKKSGNAWEALLFLSRALETNRKFLDYLLGSDGGASVCAYLVAICSTFDEPAHFDLLRLAAFLLQSITSEQFPVSTPITLPPTTASILTPSATLADLLITNLTNIIFITRARLSSLYPPFVIALTNISGRIRGLGREAAGNWVKLFLAFARPGFLLMEAGNPRLLNWVLEGLDTVSLIDNPQLIFAILRGAYRFENLATFTLSGGVDELRQERLSRKRNSVVSPNLGATPGSSSPGSRRNSVGSVFNFGFTNGRKEEDGAEKREKDEEGVEMVQVSRTTSENDRSADGEVEGETGPTRDSKMKGRRKSSSVSLAGLALEEGEVVEEEEFVGRNGFVPTEGWIASWRERLPLDRILILITELRPTLPSPLPSLASPDLLDTLASSSLRNVLPAPTAPKLRPFIPSVQSRTWLAATTYGRIYVGSFELLRSVQVELFRLRSERERNVVETIFRTVVPTA